MKSAVNKVLIILFIVSFNLSAQSPLFNRYYSEDDINLLDWKENSKPFIELAFGKSIFKHKVLQTKFSEVGLAELKLGYSSYELSNPGFLSELDEKYIFISFVSNNVGSFKTNPAEIKTEHIRFGFGDREGFGYNFGSVSIIPYTQSSFVWSKLDFKNVQDLLLTPDDINILSRYEDAFRFGTSNEGGIRFSIGPYFSLVGGYEASVIFPRHVFWKQVGSFMIYKLGIEFADLFVNEIIDSSPAAAPIINFLLKNGLSFAFYTLQREKMNWPFNSETPITFETIKLGTTFVF